MTKKFYGYYNSPIGIIEIVASENAIHSVLFVEEIKKSHETTQIMLEALTQFDEYFEGTRKNFDLSIRLNGTDFQTKVWNELMNIPYGMTISYKELATRIGNEKAVRAVGGANSKNIISIIVPCHRVIGSNKKLTGYAGGLDRKLWLLNHEKSTLVQN